jgi:hypothetical protein
VIKRAARPARNYTVLSHDVVRTPSLSYRAGGILHDILSRPDNWTASAEHLAAARPGKEGVKAIRTALKELEEAGYLKRERVRGDDGRFSWVQTVYDTPVTDTEPDADDVSAGQTISPKPPGGFPPGGNRPSKEVPRRSTEKKSSDLLCTTSGRSAPFGGGDTEDDQHVGDSTLNADTINQPDPPGSRRADDRATFKAIIGDTVRSYGVKDWNPGVFPTDAIYNHLRRRGQRRKPIDYPGAYLTAFNSDVTPAGLESWLDEQGFELVDASERAHAGG